jgi:hypothetical protein
LIHFFERQFEHKNLELRFFFLKREICILITMKLVILKILYASISWYGISETMAGNVGDACVAARTGAPGTCRMIEQCQHVRDEIIKFNRFPAPCGFQGNLQQIICCPDPPTEPIVQPPSNRISAISKFR